MSNLSVIIFFIVIFHPDREFFNFNLNAQFINIIKANVGKNRVRIET
jgi:hypothetical protein